MRITRISLFIVFATSSISVAGCNMSPQGTGEKPQLTASQQKEMQEKARQAQIDFQSAQINRSNLPPDQKQRMLDQIRSSATK